MIIIDSPDAMARALASPIDARLRALLTVRRDQLFDADVQIGALGPFLIIDPIDRLDAIEKALGFPIGTNLVDGAVFPDSSFEPSWEWREAHDGWHEIVFVLSDDGSGAVLFVPRRDDIDATIRAIIKAHADLSSAA